MPALVTLGLAYVTGVVSGVVLQRRRARTKAEAAAAARAASGRDALKRARAVLDSPLDSSVLRLGGTEAEVAAMRAQAAESAVAALNSQLELARKALTIAGSEFEAVLAEKAEAEEEAGILREILVEKDAQLRSLEATQALTTRALDQRRK